MANRIALELIADANPMMKALDNAQRTLDQFTRSAESAGKAIGGSLGNAIDNFQNFAKGGASAAGLLAGGFLAAAAGAVALTASAGRQIESLDMLSQKTGVALNTLQGWSVIMAENDFQAESLTTSMQTLSKQIVEARDPTSTAAASFEEMGIAINGLSSTESVIRALADRFQSMPDGPEKAAMAIKVLGRSGLEMIPILNRGSVALDESRHAAERFAAVLRSNQVEALKAADDAMDRVGVAAEALKSQLGAVFAPTVSMGAQALAEVIGFLATMVRNADTALDTLAIRLTHLGLAAKQLGAVLFSKDAFNTDAWKQALGNITLIDQEAAKLIAKRRELADFAPGPNPVQMSASVPGGLSADAERQVALGQKLLAQHLHQLHLVKAEQNAQEALGRVIVQMTQTKLGTMTSEEKAQEALGRTMLQIHQRERKDLAAELDLYFQTEQKLVVLTAQEEAGAKIVQQATEAWKHRNDTLEMAVEHAKVLDESQQALFATERGLFGASDAARQQRMTLIAAEGALQKKVIEETIFDERRKFEALSNLETQMDTKRRQAIQQFPSFFEQQMQAIVQSNSFSIGQITSTWTSGLANAAVNGGNFVEQAWKSTQVAVMQGLLNFGIQKAAQLALQASVELGIVSATNAAVMGLNTAKNATIVAGDAAAATATTSIWAGAAAGITGTFAVITGAITGFFTATLIPFFVSIGTALMTFLSSIAAAASATIFGIPYGLAILAGVAIIGAAIGSLMAFAFADGGIVTGPTMGLVGEAGSSEAVIPLNKRGAAFMNEALGGGKGGGPTTIIVELDKRVISRAVFDELPSIMRLRGVPA